LTVAGADARDAAAVAVIVQDADAVVSVLGVSFTREPVDTYSLGTRTVVEAMSSAGVRRLVAVCSTAAYPTRGTKAPLSLRLIEPILTRTIGKTVYDDIRRMETIARGSQLDWTIVRPSGLFDLDEPTTYLCGDVELHVAEVGDRELTRAMRTGFAGPFLLNPYTAPRPTGPDELRLIDDATADLISYGALFLANPDLPRRLSRGGPFSMSVQKLHPLIWLARIFTNSSVAAGSVESEITLPAEPRYLENLAPTVFS
jgi:NAD(P)H-binding